MNSDDPKRCLICDWTLAKTQAEGCIPGDCSYRTDDPTQRRKLAARRELIARVRAQPEPAGDVRELDLTPAGLKVLAHRRWLVSRRPGWTPAEQQAFEEHEYEILAKVRQAAEQRGRDAERADAAAALRAWSRHLYASHGATLRGLADRLEAGEHEGKL